MSSAGRPVHCPLQFVRLCVDRSGMPAAPSEGRVRLPAGRGRSVYRRAASLAHPDTHLVHRAPAPRFTGSSAAVAQSRSGDSSPVLAWHTARRSLLPGSGARSGYRPE